jgi:glycosyltransferase involved in cell wall biosynthesis
VAKRVGFAGKRKDLTSFLRMVDIYLCEFPASSASGMTGGAGVLQAMAAEKPIVAACWGEEPEQCQAALFVGSEGTIAGRDTTAYSDRVSKLIREGIYRTKLGKVMRQRVEQHFALNQTARQIEQFCDQLIQARSAATSSLSIADKVRPVPLAAVA